jgi:ribosomal protein S3
MKSMTLRLSDDIAAELDAVARVDGTTVADQVRSAIEDRIAARRADKEFPARRTRPRSNGSRGNGVETRAAHRHPRGGAPRP